MGDHGNSIAVAARQVILVRSIEHSLNQIQNDGAVVMAAADRFAADAQMLETQLYAMLDGDSSLGITKISNSQAVANLVQFADLYSVVRKNVREILDNSAQIFKVHEAALKIQAISPKLLSASVELIESIRRNDEANQLHLCILLLMAKKALYCIELGNGTPSL